jgi:NADH dehydrogenase FAD-containing subunit
MREAVLRLGRFAGDLQVGLAPSGHRLEHRAEALAALGQRVDHAWWDRPSWRTTPPRRAAWLTFVVVGAGPAGVEIAGQIAELARDTLPKDFRLADPRQGRVLLVEQADRVLTAFPPKLSQRALRSLERIGVTPLLGPSSWPWTSTASRSRGRTARGACRPAP